MLLIQEKIPPEGQLYIFTETLYNLPSLAQTCASLKKQVIASLVAIPFS